MFEILGAGEGVAAGPGLAGVGPVNGFGMAWARILPL